MLHDAGLPAPPALHIIRLLGERGPVVRCTGELTMATGEALRRELDLVASPCCPLLILNVSGCRVIDADGFALLRETCGRLGEKGIPVALVAAPDAGLFPAGAGGAGAALPVYPTEAAAAGALRGVRDELENPDRSACCEESDCGVPRAGGSR